MRWVDRTIVSAIVILLVIVGVVTATAIRGESPVEQMLIELKSEVSADNWTEAHKLLEAVDSAWQKSRPYTSFTNSTQDVQAFDEGLEQTGAFIATQSNADAAAQVAKLHQLWREFED